MDHDPLWKILHHKLKPAEIQERLRALKFFAVCEIDKKKQGAVQWLKQVLYKIDELWYHQLMIPYVHRAYRDFVIRVDNDIPDRVAGLVQDQSDSITLHMNEELFDLLFAEKRDYGYHSGGLLCKERMVCFLNVLLHETVHIILTVFECLKLRKDVHIHGREFKSIIKKLFGQTDAQHGLIKGYYQRTDLQTIRKNVHKGDTVEVLVDGLWKTATVSNTNSKWVTVKTHDDSQNYRVQFGLVRLLGDFGK